MIIFKNTYPIFKCEHVGKLTLIEDYVEDNHQKKSCVEGRNCRCGVKVSSKSDKHPAGENENPGYAAQGDSHWKDKLVNNCSENI